MMLFTSEEIITKLRTENTALREGAERALEIATMIHDGTEIGTAIRIAVYGGIIVPLSTALDEAKAAAEEEPTDPCAEAELPGNDERPHEFNDSGTCIHCGADGQKCRLGAGLPCPGPDLVDTQQEAAERADQIREAAPERPLRIDEAFGRLRRDREQGEADGARGTVPVDMEAVVEAGHRGLAEGFAALGNAPLREADVARGRDEVDAGFEAPGERSDEEPLQDAAECCGEGAEGPVGEERGPR